jgi:UDP-N-acetylglucosamine 2-epimerase (non-hydrolysing)
MCVFGTRPEAVKFAPVVKTLADDPTMQPIICVTEQHHEMLEPILRFFDLVPDHRLDIMRSNQSPSDVAARVLERLPAVLAAEQPSVVLVQGDTTTSAAAALASFYARVPVGHIEAGLRTYQTNSPFPEEMNRQITARMAEWHFAPTESARQNLLGEGVAGERVIVTGNSVIDALHWTLERLKDTKSAMIANLDRGGRMILVTAHRRESFGPGFETICRALRDLVERNPDLSIVYPVHLNPNVQAPVTRILGGCPRIYLLPPVEYPQFVDLLQHCDLVLTDSGGIQEEAPSLGKPVLVMRETTERMEGVEAGTARLVGTSRQRIISETETLLNDTNAYKTMSTAHNPYGDGKASERIAAYLGEVLSERAQPKRRRVHTPKTTMNSSD